MDDKMRKAVEELKFALDESTELNEYRAAREKYENNGKLMTMISEYNLQASLLEQEGRKPEGERDETLVRSISDRLRCLYDELEEEPDLIAMREAEEKLTSVINMINESVRCTIDPRAAADCTHDCSTCGGCR